MGNAVQWQNIVTLCFIWFRVRPAYAGLLSITARAIEKRYKIMENKKEDRRGPKDKSYVNKSEAHEVNHEPKRKKAAKKFGSGSQENDDPGQRK